jgi:hypothetical protein
MVWLRKILQETIGFEFLGFLQIFPPILGTLTENLQQIGA